MNIIYYKNLTKGLINSLTEISGDYQFVEYKGGETNFQESVLFLIGEGKPNLIQLIQKVNKQDPDIGVIVIPSDPQLRNQLKVAIQFAPFINPNVQVIDSLNIDNLKELILHEAKLSITRRKFRKTKERVVSHTSSLLKSSPQLKSSFFDKFLNQAPIGVILLNKNHMILDANKYANSLIGEGSKIKSHYFPDIFQDKKEIVDKLLQKKLPSEEGLSLGIELTQKDTKHLQLYFSEVLSVNAVYKLVVLLDVTLQVETEQRMQDYLNKLEKHNRELEQFAYILSHDLKNPLTTIKLSCEMATGGSIEEKSRFMEIINRSANNLLQMIEGLEEMVDVRKNRNPQVSQIQFQQMLDNVLNEYQFQIKDQDILIVTDFNEVPSIAYIESYMISIFHNMISNAIKYQKEEEQLKIMIKTEKSGSYTLLKISDNGIGIDLKKHKTRIFQPFRRFTDQAQGKGIGLNIIKSMIEKNNGKITIDSTVGVGTTFYCYLCPYH